MTSIVNYVSLHVYMIGAGTREGVGGLGARDSACLPVQEICNGRREICLAVSLGLHLCTLCLSACLLSEVCNGG